MANQSDSKDINFEIFEIGAAADDEDADVDDDDDDDDDGEYPMFLLLHASQKQVGMFLQ